MKNQQKEKDQTPPIKKRFLKIIAEVFHQLKRIFHQTPSKKRGFKKKEFKKKEFKKESFKEIP
ncbi:hypothetical protein [Helicobacter pylori]|uniref:hypothetical protein n=1 Tax=Helicobacter pylori TaxID=210 RepID=UPI0039E0E4E9